MTSEQLLYVKRCISDNDVHRFYIWKPWLHKRIEVLELDHYECQDCKAKGIYTPATTVHHNQFLRKHPETALDIYYEYKGIRYRNLISLCHECHEKRHGYRSKKKRDGPLTIERWD